MDIIKKYKKHKKISNLGVITISLIIALAINFFVISNDSISNNLKTNLLESERKQNIGDIYLEKSGEYISLKTNSTIKDVTNVSLSIVYNPENIEIKEVKSELSSDLSSISNTPGINTIIIDYNNSDINSSQDIFKMKVNKKENITENINIISANFTDISGDTFELQATGIIY